MTLILIVSIGSDVWNSYRVCRLYFSRSLICKTVSSPATKICTTARDSATKAQASLKNECFGTSFQAVKNSWTGVTPTKGKGEDCTHGQTRSARDILSMGNMLHNGDHMPRAQKGMYAATSCIDRIQKKYLLNRLIREF